MGIKDDQAARRAMRDWMREVVTKIVEESENPVFTANGKVLLLHSDINDIIEQLGNVAAGIGFSVEKGNTVAQYLACVLGGLKQFCEENDIALKKEEQKDGI